DTCVLNQRASQPDPPLLRDSQLDPTFSDTRIVAIRQTRDKLMTVGRARGGHHLRLTRLQLAVKDILADGPVEQKWFLADDTDLSAQRLQLDPTNVLAINRDPAGGRLIKGGQQVHQGGL